jgi:hypothetical protein
MLHTRTFGLFLAMLVCSLVAGRETFWQKNPEPDVAWGKPIESLQIGVKWDSSTKEKPLTVLLKNTGIKDILIVAWSEDVGMFEFALTAPDGSRYHAVDRLLYVPFGLAPQSSATHVRPGDVITFPFSLERFFYVPDGKGKYKAVTTVGALLKDGCKARVSFRLNQQSWKNLQAFYSKGEWIGEVDSGEIQLPKAAN